MKEKTEWGHKDWFRAVIFSIVLFLVGTILTVLFLYWLGIISLDEKVSVDGLVRVLILGSGAIAGLYALRLAIDRQEKFSKQVDVQTTQMQVQSDQSFNDKLGRGVELLADEKNVVMRCAGIRVLVDLANNASKEQKSLIVSIIYDFFYEKARIKYDEDDKRLLIPENDSRRDLQDALDFILNLPLGEREELTRKVNFHDDDKKLLRFKDLDFTRLNFLHVHLENVRFLRSYFYKTTFNVAGMVNVRFSGGEIDDSSFGSFESRLCPDTGDVIHHKSQWKISKSEFYPESIKKSKFYGVTIEETSFFFLKMEDDVIFYEIEFWQGSFQVNNKIRVLNEESLPNFIGTRLKFEMIDFLNGLKANDFFESCYYPLSLKIKEGLVHPEYIPIDSSRASDFINRRRCFIESDEDWSGQPVDEWVAVECAQHKLKQAKEEDIVSLQRELEQAKKSLREAQEALNLPKKIPKPPNSRGLPLHDKKNP